MELEFKILDGGYVRFIEAMGTGDAGIDVEDRPCDFECGIIEAARQSTQASFRGWEDKKCIKCAGLGDIVWESEDGGSPPMKCPECKGKGKITGDQSLLAFLYNGKPQHATPFEFSELVIEVQAPIMVFREWHRHRTQSYNEMSARYAPMPDNNYLPTLERCFLTSIKNKQAGVIDGTQELTNDNAINFLEGLKINYRAIEQFYQNALLWGIPKELARLCIPVGRYSRMRAKANLRNWLAFLTLRSDPAAQWEIQRYANAVGKIIEAKFPRTYNLYCKRKEEQANPLGFAMLDMKKRKELLKFFSKEELSTEIFDRTHNAERKD